MYMYEQFLFTEILSFERQNFYTKMQTGGKKYFAPAMF